MPVAPVVYPPQNSARDTAFEVYPITQPEVSCEPQSTLSGDKIVGAQMLQLAGENRLQSPRARGKKDMRCVPIGSNEAWTMRLHVQDS